MTFTYKPQLKFHKHPWRHDPRSKKFSHHAFFGTIAPAKLPDTLGRMRRQVEDQMQTLRCAAYAGAVCGGYIHGKRFSPDWQANRIGEIQGSSIDIGGSDPNAAMKSQCYPNKGGYLPFEDAPFSLAKDGPDGSGFGRWPAALTDEATNYGDAGFVRVDGPGDTFDNIRSALTLAYNPQTGLGAPVQAFSAWYPDWYTKVIAQPVQALLGFHSYVFFDFEIINGVPYLISQNSSPYVGEGGFQWWPREVVNMEFSQWNRSLKIVKPLTAEQIALAKQETPLGLIQRLIIQCWQVLSERFGNALRV